MCPANGSLVTLLLDRPPYTSMVTQLQTKLQQHCSNITIAKVTQRTISLKPSLMMNNSDVIFPIFSNPLDDNGFPGFRFVALVELNKAVFITRKPPNLMVRFFEAVSTSFPNIVMMLLLVVMFVKLNRLVEACFDAPDNDDSAFCCTVSAYMKRGGEES